MAPSKTTKKTEPRRSGPNRGSNRVRGIVDVLGRKIVDGTFPPEETLPIEPDLAEELGVGRTALREAIKVLSGKNLLDTGRRSGTKVLSPDRWNALDPDVIKWSMASSEHAESFLADLTEMRRVIEPAAAAFAAERATRREAAELLATIEDMEAAIGDQEQSLVADLEFHRLLTTASHNSILAYFGNALATLLRADFELAMQRHHAYEDNLQLHADVAEAVADGKAAEARTAVLRLIDENRKDLGAVMAGETEGGKK